MKAEQQNIKRLLNTAKGQIDGLNKMIDDDKYCIDQSDYGYHCHPEKGQYRNS